MGIGNNIRTVRLAHKMTQKELAQVLNVKQTAVSYWETDKREPDFDTVKRICDIFSITYNELLDGNWDKYMESVQQDFQNVDQGKSLRQQKEHYINQETAKLAQEMFDDPDLHALLDAAKDSRPEHIRSVTQLLKSLKETNIDG